MSILFKRLTAMKNFDFKHLAILNGQKDISDTEEAFFKNLTKNGFNPIIVDDLFAHPENLTLLKDKNIQTVVVGTTGQTKLDGLFKVFEKLNWMPKNALITRGADNFAHLSDKINLFMLMPMNFSDDKIEIFTWDEWN